MGETEERVAKLEVFLEEFKEDIQNLREEVKEIKGLLNGYLDKKIEDKMLQVVGKTFVKIFFALLTSSALISFAIEVLLRRW